MLCCGELNRGYRTQTADAKYVICILCVSLFCRQIVKFFSLLFLFYSCSPMSASLSFSQTVSSSRDNVSVPALPLWMRWMSAIALLGGIIFLGGSIVRASLAFDLFVPGTLVWKSWYSTDTIAQTIRLFAQTGFYTLSGYAVAFVGGTTVWLARRHVWRTSGWLLMSGIICLLYVPVECIQARYDIDLIYLTLQGLGTFPLDVAQTLLLKRLQVLSGIPLLAILGYCTAVMLMVWKPLERPATRIADDSSEHTPV